MSYHAKITSKGQTTIPKEVRDALGVKPGDRVVFDVEDGKATIRPVPSAWDLIGCLPLPPGMKPLSDKELQDAIREASAEAAVEQELKVLRQHGLA